MVIQQVVFRQLSDDRIKRETLSNNLSLVSKYIAVASSV